MGLGAGNVATCGTRLSYGALGSVPRVARDSAPRVEVRPGRRLVTLPCVAQCLTRGAPGLDHTWHMERVDFCAHAWYTASARQALARVRVRVGRS